MRTVAVTGGIGSGKSVVCSILSGRGIPVYDSDSEAKSLYSKDASLLSEVEKAFGCGLRLPDGSFDRAKLAEVVFSSPERLRLLESIVHPAVLEDFIRWNSSQDLRFKGQGRSEAFFGKDPFCVMESAIILDKPDFLSVIDIVVMVDAPFSVRLDRACSRDGSSPEKIRQRMDSQHFDISKVDAFIRNDGTLASLKAETEKVFSGLGFC